MPGADYKSNLSSKINIQEILLCPGAQHFQTCIFQNLEIHKLLKHYQSRMWHSGAQTLLMNNRRICNHLQHSILKLKPEIQKTLWNFLTFHGNLLTCVHSSGLPENLFMDVQTKSTCVYVNTVYKRSAKPRKMHSTRRQ